MKNRQVVLGAAVSYLAIAFNILSGLIYTPWMIRMIGDDQYALYTLALSIINLFLLDFGIGGAVTKYLSNYYAREQYREAASFMGIVYKVFFVISCLIATGLGIYYCLIDVVYVRLLPEEVRVLKRLFLIVATYSVLSFPFITFNGVLLANEEFIALKLCNLGQKVLNVLLIVWLLLAGGNVYALVLVNAISNAMFLLIKYIIIKKRTSQNVSLAYWDAGIAKSLFGYSTWTTVMGLAQRCIFNIMPTIIVALMGTTEVTVFSLASTLEGYVYVFSDAINGMFMPQISRIIVGENVEENITKLMSKVGQYHIWTLGLIFVGFLVLGDSFVDNWLGEGYWGVYFCTAILIFPSLIEIPQQVANTTLLAKDVVKQQALVYSGMAVLNILLSFLIIPVMGIIGASIAICISYLFRAVGLNILYRKYLKIDLKYYFKTVYSKWIGCVCVTAALGFPIAQTVTMEGWLGLVIKAVLICGIYLTLFAFVQTGWGEKK